MKISPKQFLKARHPNQFSDSEIIDEPQIDSTILEFYLDTLTSRNQEVEFENFGIRLCRAAITPNLMPNTGPTGGGDGKVDSETYPVARETTLTWYTCVDPKAASDRWGFAFSVQKDWGDKIRSDIKKIHDTGRGYKVAYFVSSKSIRAKDKARVQDELSKEYGIDVRILDRNWILKEVFENQRQEIVEKELHIATVKPEIKKGPLDSQKEEFLKKLDNDVEKSISENRKSPAVVDDAISSAILSRELEKPRVEIDGRFNRAKRLADEFGSVHQQFEAAYQFAWTTFWWHEDFPTYVALYQPAEDAAIGTANVYNLERLTNLWLGLINLRNRSDKGMEIIKNDLLGKHTKILKDELEDISKQEEKPNAALYARMLLLTIELAEKKYSEEDTGKTLLDIKSVIEESKNLIGFPFKPLVQALTESGDVFENNPEYSSLFETILKITEERDGETAAAKLSLCRAENLIRLGRPYEAITGLGISLRKLYKHESRNDAVRALYLIGIAYEQVGLLWAARGALLSAASLATSEFWNYGNINTMQAACYNLLKWLELRLGRLPQALDWHSLDRTVRKILVDKGIPAERMLEQIDKFDMALGVLFLRSDLNTLKTLEYLPSALEELGLMFSPIALIYSLGQEEKIPDEFTTAIPASEMEDFFSQWAKQYSPGFLPAALAPTESATTQLISNVLGCTIIANTENQSPCVEVAESILSAIESFLSTSTLKHAVSREPVVEINLDTSAKKDLIELEIDDNSDRPIIAVHCQKFNPHSVSSNDQGKLKDLIFDALAQIIARFVIFEDHEKTLTEIIRDERASERALSFTGSFVTLGNVLGHTPKIKISEVTNKKKQRYELKRANALVFATAHPEEKKASKFPEESDGNSRLELSHIDMKTVSIIREPFWDEAKWLGTGYIFMPDRAPVLSIMFTNIEAGKKIFLAWQKKFGEEDNNEAIRVSIVEGVDSSNPYHYVVGVGSNIEFLKKGNMPKRIISPTRRNTMMPQNSENLDNFKKAYSQFGYYLLAPGFVDADNLPHVIFSHGIIKKEIHFREASKIGLNDPDIILTKLSSTKNVAVPLRRT